MVVITAPVLPKGVAESVTTFRQKVGFDIFSLRGFFGAPSLEVDHHRERRQARARENVGIFNTLRRHFLRDPDAALCHYQGPRGLLLRLAHDLNASCSVARRSLILVTSATSHVDSVPTRRQAGALEELEVS